VYPVAKDSFPTATQLVAVTHATPSNQPANALLPPCAIVQLDAVFGLDAVLGVDDVDECGDVAAVLQPAARTTTSARCDRIGRSFGIRITSSCAACGRSSVGRRTL
jgi:hypothetical protein